MANDRKSLPLLIVFWRAVFKLAGWTSWCDPERLIVLRHVHCVGICKYLYEIEESGNKIKVQLRQVLQNLLEGVETVMVLLRRSGIK